MKKYVIDTREKQEFTAGSKARNDINEILERKGYDKKYIYINSKKSKIFMFRDIFTTYKDLKRIVEQLENNSELIIQFPWDSLAYKYAKYIKKMSKRKSIKTIVIIHDINSLRSSDKFGLLYFKYLIREIDFLNCFDYIICHNDKMKKYLVNNGISDKKIISLGIFDYLVDFKNKVDVNGNFKCVNIAGNLLINKSKYIYCLDQLKSEYYNFELFGINYTGKNDKFLKYNGSFDPTKLIKKVNTGFGLVWDGASIDKCDGNWGEYLKWNNPHKFSLYMACGIPVFVWKKSALATFVKQNEVGIVINSLKEIENIFKNMTKKDYIKYVKNVEKIQKRVIEGQFLNDAIEKCR